MHRDRPQPGQQLEAGADERRRAAVVTKETTTQPAGSRTQTNLQSTTLTPSPRIIAQRQQMDSIARSPRMVAQRQQLDSMLGGRSVAEAMPLPQPLSAGIEALSGLDMSGVRVYRNSDQPAQLNAHAYTQGQTIHLGPGQEQHLAHEAWHVVQQQQGRVRGSTQLAGVSINDDPALEREADVMGAKALQALADSHGSVAGAFGSQQPLTPLQLSANPPVAQLLKLTDPGPRKEKTEKWPQAAPFQLAAVQFSADYDITQYATEIKAYGARCLDAETIPVIELRMYDAATPDSAQKYVAEARKLLVPIIGGEYFDLICSMLRDETLTPEKNMDEEQQSKALGEFAKWLRTVTDVPVQGPLTQDKTRAEALNPPAGKMLTGGMMIPLPEALHFATLNETQLQEIYAQTGQQRYSLHHRLLAKVLLQTEKPKVNVNPSRLRRNSLVRPDTVTITNLVTGSETDTLQSTLAACWAALKKGAKQVYLIIEARGDDGSRRAARQIEALQKAGLTVDFIQEIQGAKGVQQSGVMLNEPGEIIPTRVKVRVHFKIVGRNKMEQWLQADALKQYISKYTYEYWYEQQVHSDVSDALEYENVYYPNYLDDLCALFPQYVVAIHDLNPAAFKRTYPHHQDLYEKQVAANREVEAL